MNRSNQILKDILKSNRLSVTNQRLLIFNILSQNQPLSMNELIKKTNSEIDRVSVYRIIETFISVGIAQKVSLGWKYKIELSDTFQDHHHHLICLACNKTIAIHNQGLESYLNKIDNENNFETKNHQIEIQGYCPDCQKS